MGTLFVDDRRTRLPRWARDRTADIGLLRLVAQRLAGPRRADRRRRGAAARRRPGPGPPRRADVRGTADGGPARADVEAALDAGTVVRSWPMRGTLHLIGRRGPALDARHCSDGRLLAGRSARGGPGSGSTDAIAERARELVVEAMTGGRRAGRSGAARRHGRGRRRRRGPARLPPALVPVADRHAVPRARGRDGEQQFVLLDEWIPDPRRLDREEALAELALRFFRGHGPATVKDLARWAYLRVTEARAGLAAVRDGLASLEVDGTEYFLDPATPDRLADGSRGGVRHVPAARVRRVRPRLRRPQRRPRSRALRPDRARRQRDVPPTVVHAGGSSAPGATAAGAPSGW